MLVQLRDLRRPNDIIAGRVGASVRDVVGYRVGEQEHVLLYHADVPAERLQRHVPHVDIVNCDRSLRHVVEAGYQAGKGALAAARRAQESDDFPGGNVEIEVTQDQRVLAVLEAHVLEPHVAGRPPHLDGVAAVLDRRFGVEHLEDARRGRHRPREVVHDHARHAERLGQDLQIEDELRELAKRHAPVDHAETAEQQHHAERQQEDEQHERAVERVEPHGPVHVVGNGLVVDTELLLLVVGGGERLDHLRTCQVLLQRGVQDRQLLLDLEPGVPHPQPYQAGHAHRHGQQCQADQPQLPVESHHQDDDHDEEHDEVGRAHDDEVDEHPDRLHVGNRLGHQFPGVLPVVEAEAKVLDVVVEPVAQVVDDVLAQRLAHVHLAEREYAAHHAEPDDQYAGDKNGGVHRLARLDRTGHVVDRVAEEFREEYVCGGSACCEQVRGQEAPLVV